MARWVLLFTLALATTRAGAQSVTPTSPSSATSISNNGFSATATSSAVPTSILDTGGTTETTTATTVSSGTDTTTTTPTTTAATTAAPTDPSTPNIATTDAPTTAATTAAPTDAPTTEVPTTTVATTDAPTTTAATTDAPTAPIATTDPPTTTTTTDAPTTEVPTTPVATTDAPTTEVPTTTVATTDAPTTDAPTTTVATTDAPTTEVPTSTVATTDAPTTTVATTDAPTTEVPTTTVATTDAPTTTVTTTDAPTTEVPTTTVATTDAPTTTVTTTDAPTTEVPTTTVATTDAPTTTETSTTAPTTTETVTPDPPTTNTTTPDPPTTNTTTPDPPTTNTTTPDPPTTNTTTPDPPTTNTTTPDPPTTNTTTPDPPTTNTTTPDPPTTNTTTPDPPTTNTTTSNPPTTTTAPTTTIPTTSPSTTPLVCNNTGESQNGVCICPDEWTGETCSVENFCRAREEGVFNFPKTVIGWFAYSIETCPEGTSGAGKPRASVRCTRQNGQPDFQLPLQVLQCDQTLSDIQQNLTSIADLETLASSTQILTSNPEELTAENVTTAAQIANTLLLSPNATANVRVAAITTVSQLLGANTADASSQNNATLGLTLTLDQVSVTSPESQVVQPNLVVQSAQIPAVDTQGVQFTALSGQSSNFIPDRIQLNTNTSAVEVENGFAPDALIHVQFPPGVSRSRQGASNVSLGFVLYQNDRFFRSKRYHSERVTVRVLSASVGGYENSTQPPHVEMAFRPMMISGVMMHDFACVFWDYTLEDWSTEGCYKGNASDGLLRCFCNHTTNFAALWSFRQTYKYAEALRWISIVGLSVSIVGLVVTIIHHVRENVYRGSRDNNKSMKLTQLFIYISLLAFIITYLSGAENHNRMADAPTAVSSQINAVPDSEEHVMKDRGSCTAVAALLHFFLLATFMWTSIYGTELVLVLRTMHRTLPPNWTTGSVAVGWGVPSVVMVITLAATYRVDNPLGYRQEEFCWLAGVDQDKHFDFAKPMFWGFILPLGLILLYNVVLLVQVSLTTCRTNPELNRTNKLSFWKKFLISFSLGIILGLSWILGYLVLLMSGTANLVFSIIFCLCTTTQGFLIFLLFTARTPTFRDTVSSSVRYVSSFSRQFSGTSYDLYRNSKTSISMGSYKDLKERQESEV